MHHTTFLGERGLVQLPYKYGSGSEIGVGAAGPMKLRLCWLDKLTG